MTENALKKKYKRLSLAKSFLAVNSLWMGPDHLMLVTAHMANERYHRFYFADIQALILRKTVAFWIINFLTGAPAGVFLLWAAFYRNDTFVPVLVFIAAIFLVLFLANLIKGPTCDVWVQTAIQTRRIPAIDRTRRFARVMRRVLPKIEAAQGRLPAGALSHPLPQGSPAMRREKMDSKNRPIGPLVHGMLFGALLFQAAMVGLDLAWPSWPAGIVAAFSGTAVLILAIIAAARQTQGQMAAGLRRLTWWCLGYALTQLAAGYVVQFVMVIQFRMFRFNYWQLWRRIAAISPWTHPLLLTVGLYLAVGSALFGLLGGFLLFSSRRRPEAVMTTDA